MVVPDAIPVTMPVTPTVPVAMLVLLHVPPVVMSLSGVVAPPAHTTVVPVIAAGLIGKGFTVAITLAASLPQLFV